MTFKPAQREISRDDNLTPLLFGGNLSPQVDAGVDVG